MQPWPTLSVRDQLLDELVHVPDVRRWMIAGQITLNLVMIRLNNFISFLPEK